MILDYIEEHESDIEEHMYEHNYPYNPKDHHAPLSENMPDWEIEEYVREYMMEQYYAFIDTNYNLITLDDNCKEYLAKAISKDFDTKPSRASLLGMADQYIVQHSFKEICEKLKEVPFYTFKTKQVVKRITKESPTSVIIAPIIVARKDKDNIGIHILSVVVPESGDEVIHTMPIAGNNHDGHNDCYMDLIDYCTTHHWYTAGISLFGERPDAPASFIYGLSEKDVLEYKERLEDKYGIKH